MTHEQDNLAGIRMLESAVNESIGNHIEALMRYEIGQSFGIINKFLMLTPVGERRFSKKILPIGLSEFRIHQNTEGIGLLREVSGTLCKVTPDHIPRMQLATVNVHCKGTIWMMLKASAVDQEKLIAFLAKEAGEEQE